MTTATATPVEQNGTGTAPYTTAAAAANGTAPVAAAGADEVIQFLNWRIEPHLVDNYLVASGRLSEMARLLDPLAGESAAFNVYRRESYDGNPLELVAVIVPQRHNAQPWPDEMDSGAQIITAQEYAAAGDGFIVLANLGRLLSDEDKHALFLRLYGDVAPPARGHGPFSALGHVRLAVGPCRRGRRLVLLGTRALRRPEQAARSADQHRRLCREHRPRVLGRPSGLHLLHRRAHRRPRLRVQPLGG